MTPPFLERIKIVGFGAFSGKVVGPFTPRLNVVFGRNEAGKTTLASFVGGVLFGWEDARGSRNTYKPANAERSGSLFFAFPHADEDGDLGQGEEIELSRIRNADGLQGDASIVADIDKETFQTMFSLTSDELRSLRNTTDVTAKLLTAGSGTGASPAHALSEVDEQLATYTSRAAGAEHSLVRLAAEQDDLRAQMAAASEEAERFKREDKEFRDLAPQRDEMMARLDALNAEIEALTARRAHAEKLDREIAEARDRVASIREEEAALAAGRRAQRDDDLAPLMGLAAADERALRDRIDALASEEAKCEHAVDLAQDNFATSKAAYEALLEAGNASAAKGHARRQRSAQVALSILLPLVFITAGVPLFIHGREIASLSFTALGAGLVMFAVMIALGALVMLFRPDKAADAREARERTPNGSCYRTRRSWRRACRAKPHARSAPVRSWTPPGWRRPRARCASRACCWTRRARRAPRRTCSSSASRPSSPVAPRSRTAWPMPRASDGPCSKARCRAASTPLRASMRSWPRKRSSEPACWRPARA